MLFTMSATVFGADMFHHLDAGRYELKLLACFFTHAVEAMPPARTNLISFINIMDNLLTRQAFG